jgi:hypothetical protein
MNSFDFYFTNLLNSYKIADSAVGPLTNKDLTCFCKRFEASANIDLVSDDRIVFVDI